MSRGGHMLGPEWQLPNEDAAPALVRIYYIIDLVILSIGTVIFTRTLFMWRVAFQRVGSALQSYAWIALGDAFTLVNFLLMSSFGLAYGHLPDTFACKVNAFISMVLAYSLAHVYLSTSGIALLIMLGFNDKKPFFKRAAFAFSGFGYIYGIVISIIYGVAGMFGNYRNMYCMIPVDKYNNWGLILGFVFVGFQVLVCVVINIISFCLSRSTALETRLGPREKGVRIRAYRSITNANMAMITIFCLCQGLVLVVEVMIWVKAPIPIIIDLFTGFLYKSQPTFNSLLIYHLLHKVVERELKKKKTISNLPWWKQLMYWLQPPVVSPEVPTDEEAQQQQNSDSSIMPSDPSLSTQASKAGASSAEGGPPAAAGGGGLAGKMLDYFMPRQPGTPQAQGGEVSRSSRMRSKSDISPQPPTQSQSAGSGNSASVAPT